MSRLSFYPEDMPEELTDKQILENQQQKAAALKQDLMVNYDDSSDDEDLDYNKVVEARKQAVREDIQLNRFQRDLLRKKIQSKSLEYSDIPALQAELEQLYQQKEDLEEKLFEAKQFLSDKPAYVMEIEGRKTIYNNSYKYYQRKKAALGEVKFEVKTADEYNDILFNVLKKHGFAKEDRIKKLKEDQGSIKGLFEFVGDPSWFIEQLNLEDIKFLFDEENKHTIIRKFLRQTNLEFVDEILKEIISDLVKELGYNLPLSNTQIKSIVKSFVAELPKVRRPVLPRTRVNPNIESPADFYAEQMLRYRSLTRNSREIAGDKFQVAQSMSFDAESDLVSQKTQTVSRDERSDAPKDRFAHRGTVSEEVLNLGNYKDVLEKIKKLGFDDKNVAKIIRAVFVKGAKAAFSDLSVGEGENQIALKDYLTPEKKQIVIDIVELLFGTEGFRSPSAIVETNMLLDLIIEDPANWNFDKAFVGKNTVVKGKETGNGGALSFTMKALNNLSGGIACGRNLSRSLDELLKDPSLRSHKYGGPHKVNSDDFKEYLQRKEEIAKSWVDKCTAAYSMQDLSREIGKSRVRWYGESR